MVSALEFLPCIHNLELDFAFEDEEVMLLEQLENLEALNGTKLSNTNSRERKGSKTLKTEKS